ncbi:MAG: hypothetical protein ACYC28_15485 [Longimicrobiales bacterium]
MSTSVLTYLRKSNPRLADDFVRWGAHVARRSSSTDKRLGSALRVDRSRGTRYRNGSDPHSPFANSLALHHQLAHADTAQAWSLIVAEKVVVRKAEIERASLDELRARLAELNDIEHHAEMEENAAVLRAAIEDTPESHIAAAEADEREAEIAEERSAIRRRIADLLRSQNRSA